MYLTFGKCQYGLGTVVAISKPSSKVNAKEIEGFINIDLVPLYGGHYFQIDCECVLSNVSTSL
jgi:hypothetical protein